MRHSFLLIGQSNMAGRGFLNEVEPIENNRIKMLRNGRFIPMFQPVNCDRKTSGVNLAESFADLYSREMDVEVGLIPCADGGSSLDMWKPGEVLFDHACYMAELASRSSTVAGVLWHQGESDSSDELFPFCEEKLTHMIQEFRNRLGLHRVPFILGGLGDFLMLRENAEKYRNYAKVNEVLMRMAENDPLIGFASAENLDSNPDHLHFSAKALREFGERYYRAFVGIAGTGRVFEENQKFEEEIHTEIEML